MTNKEKAKENFLSGYNCCQAVLIAYAKEIDMNEKSAAMLASSFGAGMGGLREVCGAVTAMFMVAGAKDGYINDDTKKKEHYKRIRELAEKFKEKNDTIICSELLKGLANVKENPQIRTEEYYKVRPCLKFVMDAANIIDEMIVKRAD